MLVVPPPAAPAVPTTHTIAPLTTPSGTLAVEFVDYFEGFTSGEDIRAKLEVFKEACRMYIR